MGECDHDPAVRDSIVQPFVTIVLGCDEPAVEVDGEQPSTGMVRPEERASGDGAVKAVDRNRRVESSPSKGIPQRRSSEVASDTRIDDQLIRSERHVNSKRVCVPMRRKAPVTVRSVVEDQSPATVAEKR